MRKRKSSLLHTLAFLASVPFLASAVEYAPPQSVQPPEFSYDRLGDIFLAGDFDGISQIDYAGQIEMLANAQTELDDLIVHYESDVYTKQAFSNGIVLSSCTMGDNEMVVMAGNFTSIFNQSVPNGLAAVNFNNKTAYSLGNSSRNAQGNEGGTEGLNGSNVHALWCNGSQAYFGGDFRVGESYGTAIWNQPNNSWTLPAFGGFTANSTVNAIIPYGNNIVFGGDFNGLAQLTARANSTNSSMQLMPGMQPVSFSAANASGYSSSEAQAQNASSILCPYSSESGWSAELDSYTGYIDIALAYLSQPTRIRLFNLPDGSGTKSFRIISEPAGSFMNLTYTDEEGQEQNCAAQCPLPEYNNTIRYTDFRFVNVVPTSSMRIELLEFYGTHAGLKGVQLFEAGQFAFADNVYNYPRQCGADAGGGIQQTTSSATANLTGSTPWSEVSDFMAANITDQSKLTSYEAKLSPTFDSYVIDRGHYEVLLYTPGCEQYDTCGQRGMVNVSVYPGFGVPQSTVLYQTNNELKYDLVYNGTMQHGSYISIVPTSANNVPMDLVAYKVRLNYLGRPEVYNASKLFEYSVANFSTGSTESSPVGSTVINTFGQRLGSNASVTALLLNGTSSLFIGGASFPSNVSNSPNLISLPLSSPGTITGISGVGSSETVEKMFAMNQTQFVLSSNETYELTSTQNGAEGSGTNGSGGSQDLEASSLHLGPMSTAIPFVFNNTDYLMFSSDSSLNASFWDVKAQSLSDSDIPVSGRVTGAFPVQNVTVYTGSLRIADTFIPNGAAVLSESTAENPGSPKFTIKEARRSTGGFMNEISQVPQWDSSISGALYAGTFINSSHSIVVGHFNATTSDNSTVSNALILSDDRSSAALFDESGFNLPADTTTFYSVASLNGTTVVGGNFTGKAASKQVQGLILANSSGGYSQPSPLNPGGDVSVNAVFFQPNTSDVFVGGSFSSADNVVTNGSCNGVCLYSLEQSQWTVPESLVFDKGSTVNDLVFETAQKLVIGGSLSQNNNKHQVAVYDLANRTLNMLPQLPGPVSSLVVLSNSTENSQYAVSGSNGSSVFIKWFDGSSNSWRDVPNLPLHEDSQIMALSLVILSNATHGSTGSPFNSSKSLLVSGALSLDEGPVSSIVFNGQDWSALYGTTSRRENSTGMVQAVFAQYGGDLKGGVQYEQATRTSHPRPTTSPSPQGGQNNKEHHYMAKGHVVGIACGIGLCCVLVLMLLYIITEYALTKGSRTFAYENLAQSRAAADKKAI